MDTVQLFCKIASSGQISVWEYLIVNLIGGVFDATEFLQPQPTLQKWGFVDVCQYFKYRPQHIIGI